MKEAPDRALSRVILAGQGRIPGGLQGPEEWPGPASPAERPRLLPSGVRGVTLRSEVRCRGDAANQEQLRKQHLCGAPAGF